MDGAAVHAALAALVGDAHVLPSPALTDSTGRDVGRPRWVVQPGSTAEVVALVQLCRERRIVIVPVGSRTAYWSPLRLDNSVAVDVSRLHRLEVANGVVRAGAGWPVRLLDQALRRGGAHLPLHPDAFGDTQLGSLVATACTSGIGMGSGSWGQILTGVEWVSGAGTAMWTGAADRSGVAPFMREGRPELTSLLLGSEGGLGIVTELAFRRRPPPWRMRLSGQAPSVLPLFPLGAELAGVYDTFRVQRTSRGSGEWTVDVWVVSTFSAREAAERAVEVARRLRIAGVSVRAPEAETAAARTGRSPDYDERWNGPLNGLGDFLARASLRGVDVNAPWSAAEAVLHVLENLVAAQVAAGVSESRLAMYAAPDFVNFGVHATVLPGESWSDEDDTPTYDALLALPVIPYRVGRRWPRGSADALGSRDVLRALKSACDPDGILAPGVGPWS